MATKRDEVREFLKREAAHALKQQLADLQNREHAELLRGYVGMFSTQIAWHIAEEYRFLELADLMEWRRTRVRR